MKAIQLGRFQYRIKNKKMFIRCPECNDHFTWITNRDKLARFNADHRH